MLRSTPNLESWASTELGRQLRSEPHQATRVAASHRESHLALRVSCDLLLGGQGDA